jgi:hypothetical protein
MLQVLTFLSSKVLLRFDGVLVLLSFVCVFLPFLLLTLLQLLLPQLIDKLVIIDNCAI